MSLWNVLKQLKRRWDGTTDEAAEALKDPLQDHRLNIKAGEKKLEEFRTRIANLMASTTGIRRKLQAKEADSQKYDNIAKQAAEAGKVDDIRAAAEIKLGVDAEIAELSHQLKMEEQQVTQLRGLLADGEKKVEQAKGDLTLLAARHEGAQIRDEMAKAGSEFLGDGGFSSLGDLRKLVEQEEDVATAREELAGASVTSGAKRLEETYIQKTNADAEVQKYLDAASKKEKGKKA